MSDQLFIVLRVCLLALVYLVFLRVLRAVWVETRAESAPLRPAAAPRPAAARPQAPARVAAGASPAAGRSPAPTTVSSSGGRLVVVAPPSIAGHTFDVSGETTIGRAPGCAVAIDDAHISKVHARVYPHEGSWLLEDLGSTNGTELDGETVSGPTPLSAGARISIGEIVLEFV